MNQYAFKTINHSSKCYNNFNLGKAKRSFASNKMQISTDRSHNKISSGNLFSVPNNLLFESNNKLTESNSVMLFKLNQKLNDTTINTSRTIRTVTRESDDDCKVIRDRINDYRDMNNKLRTKISLKEIEKQCIEKKGRGIIDKINKMKEVKEQLESTNGDLKRKEKEIYQKKIKDFAYYEKKRNDIINEIDRNKKKTKSLEEDREQLLKANSHYEDIIKQMKSTLIILNQRTQQRENKENEYKEQLKHLDNLLEERTKVVNALLKQNDKLIQENKTNEIQIESMMKDVSGFTKKKKEIIEVRIGIDDLKKIVARVNEDIHKKNVMIAKLEIDTRELNKKKGYNQSNDIKKKIKKLREENTLLEIREQELKDKNDRILDEYVQMKRKYEKQIEMLKISSITSQDEFFNRKNKVGRLQRYYQQDSNDIRDIHSTMLSELDKEDKNKPKRLVETLEMNNEEENELPTLEDKLQKEKLKNKSKTVINRKNINEMEEDITTSINRKEELIKDTTVISNIRKKSKIHYRTITVRNVNQIVEEESQINKEHIDYYLFSIVNPITVLSYDISNTSYESSQIKSIASIISASYLTLNTLQGLFLLSDKILYFYSYSSNLFKQIVTFKFNHSNGSLILDDNSQSLIVISGDSTEAVESFSFKTNSISSLPSLNYKRSNAMSLLINNCLYSLFGCDPDINLYLNTIEYLDLNKEQGHFELITINSNSDIKLSKAIAFSFSEDTVYIFGGANNKKTYELNLNTYEMNQSELYSNKEDEYLFERNNNVNIYIDDSKGILNLIAMDDSHRVICFNADGSYEIYSPKQSQ